ncbi:MAG: hypothetical protein Q7J84_13865 [Sulfuricaulis sp.]|nr:hypothetical protein [Sulfuricaulis sp.]
MNTLIEREQMKFVINNRTFDTDTSQTVAISRGARTPENPWDDDFPAQSVRYENVLYRTAKGALFVHYHKTMKFDRGKPVVDDSAQEVTPEEAISWIQMNLAAVIDPTGLTLPPEA